MPAARGPSPLVLRSLMGLLACLALAVCGPSDPLQAIREQQAAGDLAGSIEALRVLLAERPDDAEVNYLYGSALALSGQPSLAEWSLRKAMQDPDWRVPATMRLAYGALATQNYAEAIELTTSLLEQDPENVDALMMRANAYTYSRLDQEAALADVDRIREIDPENLDAMKPRILALLGLERTEEAAEAIEELGQRIAEESPESGLPGWHCATAAIFADESGEEELARQRWTDCLERYPAHPNVVVNALEFYNTRGELDRSIELLRRAREESPGSRDYRTRLAGLLRRTGQNQEAEALLREATQAEEPVFAAAGWLDLAQHYDAVEDYGAAAEASERAIELVRRSATPSPQLLFEYADSLVVAGRLDDALEVAEELTVPAHRELILARVAQQRDQPAEALEHFDEAFRLWPDNPWARYYAALAAEALGDFDRAIEAYRYAIRIDPGGTDARLRLARLHLAEGKPLNAVTALRHMAQQAGLDEEGELLSIQLWAQAGLGELGSVLTRFRATAPDRLGQAVAAAAQGVRNRSGAAAALALLREQQAAGLDLTEPRHAEALRALVRFSIEAGRPEPAEAALEAALRAHPDAAAANEIRGLWLEQSGAPRDEARAAYARAVELEPTHALALTGLGRLALADGAAEPALGFFERAAAADPDAAEPLRGAGEALRAAGRPAEAEQRLETLLKEHPYDAAAAEQLVELQLARGIAGERTLELARRAVRFGGGADALDLLSRVYAQRNEPERASQAAARARALRERQES